MKTGIKVVAAFAVGLALVIAVRVFWLHAGVSGRSEEPMLLSYEVPAEISQEVQRALSSALSAMGKDSDRIGTVIAAPGGRLIVTATPSVQAGVGQILDDIKSRKLPPTPTVGFDLWIVTGSRGGSASTRDAPLPAELAPAVESLRKARGDLRFSLLEHLSTSSQPGREKSGVEGSRAAFRVDSSLQNGTDGKPRVVARIEVQGLARFIPGQQAVQPFALTSQATLVPGELLVVGQGQARTAEVWSSAGQPANRAPEEDIAGQEIYYVVRATL